MLESFFGATPLADLFVWANADCCNSQRFHRQNLGSPYRICNVHLTFCLRTLETGSLLGADHKHKLTKTAEARPPWGPKTADTREARGVPAGFPRETASVAGRSLGLLFVAVRFAVGGLHLEPRLDRVELKGKLQSTQPGEISE